MRVQGKLVCIYINSKKLIQPVYKGHKGLTMPKRDLQESKKRFKKAWNKPNPDKVRKKESYGTTIAISLPS